MEQQQCGMCTVVDNRNHRQSPPGYFKKRKCDASNFKPPERRQRGNFMEYLSMYQIFIIVLFLIMDINVNATTLTTSTIEPDLKVLSLSTMSTTTTQLSSANSTLNEEKNETRRICQTIEVRESIASLNNLKGCRVVEGSLNILMLDELTEENLKDLYFPDLVEITGYLLIYRMSGVKSLNSLFPNLAIIRGKDLFKHYALVLFEMEDLEEVGLYNLQVIQRGSVRIEKNAKLCFAQTVNWTAITVEEVDENYILKNKVAAHCPQCPTEKDGGFAKDQSCLTVEGKKEQYFCWNKDICQRKCKYHHERSCSRRGNLCHESCIGGCDDDDPNKCVACRKIDIGIPDAICTEDCLPHLFKFEDKRCITEDECRKLVPKEEQRPYIPFNFTCMSGCPKNYKEDNGTCTECPKDGKPCFKICKSKIVDSVQAAQTLQGCNYIEGNLEISIKSSKNTEKYGSIVKQLENSLSGIEEITGYLKIARSYPIISLSFLKNLRKIHGNNGLDNNKYSVYIWDNNNLQKLFLENQKVEILRGKVLFYLNPKLCYDHIANLVKDESMIEDIESTKKTNGDRNPCNVTLFDVDIDDLSSNHAILKWDPLPLNDDRKLLNYVVYHMATNNNITIWESREACGNDGWSTDDVEGDQSNNRVVFPMFHLQPHTRYAFYVQAFILQTEKINAMSEIHYFRTEPGKPQPVQQKNFKVSPLNSSAFRISWDTRDLRINGNFEKYILRLKLLDSEKIERNYCDHPLESSQFIDPKIPEIEEKKKVPEILATCDCKTCLQTCERQTEIDDADKRQYAILFEDEIQDFVWKKQPDEPPRPPEQPTKKAKRQIPEKFPTSEDNNDTIKTKKVPSDRLLMRNNSYGEYDHIIIPIADETNTSLEITNLIHYSRYQVSIQVCRSTNNENDNEACSAETSVNINTEKDPTKDTILWFDCEAIASNFSNVGAIKVTWTIPKRPNGAILAYNIRHKRNDIDHTKPEDTCITQDNFLKSNYNPMDKKGFHVIDKLQPGNYSVYVWCTSMAGPSPLPSPKTTVISEKAHFPIQYLIILLVFVVLIFGAAIFWIKKQNSENLSNMKLIANVNPDYAGVDYQQDDWEVPRDRIILLHELGQGSFGMVYEGIIKDLKRSGSDEIVSETRCAIKTVNENATDRERGSFLSEASVMKQFDTAFVVKLLGVVTVTQPTYVVMELMPNGDLKGYLRLHRAEYNDETPQPPPQPPTIRQMLQMAAEIADGMSYLAAKKYVHRDLAARNCMVADDLTVKIGDFGMTRDIYETDYYRKGTKGLLPVRWMSPESLKDGVFSTASDVFSYGVVLWEIATLASQPYQGFSNDQTLRYVIDGGVMERPENCPDRLYEIMRRCWQHRPSARPSFLEIIDSLRDAVNDNFRNVSYFYSKEGQDLFNQQRQADFSIQMTDDVTTPLTLRQDDENDELTSSIGGNNFLMQDLSGERRRKLHDLK